MHAYPFSAQWLRAPEHVIMRACRCVDDPFNYFRSHVPMPDCSLGLSHLQTRSLPSVPAMQSSLAGCGKDGCAFIHYELPSLATRWIKLGAVQRWHPLAKMVAEELAGITLPSHRCKEARQFQQMRTSGQLRLDSSARLMAC